MTLSYAGAFIGGILTIFAPCSAALLPAFFAYSFTSRRTMLGRTGIFFLGLLLVLLPLGAGAGFLTSMANDYSNVVSAVTGVIIVVAGIWVALNLPVPHLPQKKATVGVPAKQREPGSPIAVFLLGITYGLAGVGCAGPILFAVLAIAGLGGNSVQGAITMFFYALGTFFPVLLLALLWEGFDLGGKKWMRPRPIRFLGRDTTVGAVISGVIFIILGGILIAGGSLNLMPSVLNADQQSQIETSVQQFTQAVPNWVFVVLVLLIVALIATLLWQRNQNRKRREAIAARKASEKSSSKGKKRR